MSEVDTRVEELIEEVIAGAFDPEELHAKYLHERDKRLRPEGNSQYVKVTTEFSRRQEECPSSDGRQPLTDEVEVAIIGAGFGGLLLGTRLRQGGVESIRLIDEAGDVGGTWYWNRYPGAACDVESYIYLPLLEETGYIPTQRYAKGPEIFAHCQRIARTFDLYDRACFDTRVTEVFWDSEYSRWIIQTNRGDRMRAKFVAMANGRLSTPKLPGIPGINEFEGHTFHTSRWDYTYTGGNSSGGLDGLKNKRVGIIGTGATAIQCIPHLGESAEHLYVFQRTPSSVDVRNNQSTDSRWADSLEPGWQRRRIENFNTLVSGGDADEDLVADGWTDIYRNVTGLAIKRVARELGRRLTADEKERLTEAYDYRKMNQIRARIDSIVEDASTAESLKPWYRQFCKRPCFHDEYLPTFNRSNVTLVDTQGQGVTRLTKNAVVVGEHAYKVDCLVFATGFEVGTEYTSRVGYDVYGKNGKSLSEHWAGGVRTHLGFMLSGFPNLFMLGFAQTATTVNIPHALDEQSRHIAYLIDTTRSGAYAEIEATVKGEDWWISEMRDKARMTEKFYAECTPGYYNNEGKTGNPNSYFANTYGAGPLRFFSILEEWRSDGKMDGVTFDGMALSHSERDIAGAPTR